MTQAYNLSQLANNLNTTGQLDATDGLVNAVPATNGGTGQAAYAVGDLLYASTTTALSKLADVATGNAVISGGVGVAPAYGKVGLTTHVSGTLPVANGGTGAAALTLNNVVLGNGTSAVQLVAPGTSGNVLTSNGTTWASTAAGGGVTSWNGQTGAVVSSTLGAIGSVQQLFYTSTTTPIIAGTTVAGTSLLYPTSLVGMSTVGAGMILSGSLTTVANTSALYAVQSYLRRTISGNTGWVSPLGTSAATGTWRCIGGGAQPAQSFYDSCAGDTTAYTYGAMFVRIS